MNLWGTRKDDVLGLSLVGSNVDDEEAVMRDEGDEGCHGRMEGSLVMEGYLARIAVHREVDAFLYDEDPLLVKQDASASLVVDQEEYLASLQRTSLATCEAGCLVR